MVDKLIIIHIFKKSVNNTKEERDQRKNSGCNVIFGVYLSLPNCNSSLLPLFICFTKNINVFSFFQKIIFRKKIISNHSQIIFKLPIMLNLINKSIIHILS